MHKHQNGKRLHPMLWVAALSVTTLSAVGIAAVTGVLPVSAGHQEIQSESRVAIAEKAGSLANAQRRETPAPTSSVRSEPTQPVTQPESASATDTESRACTECGVIESVRAVRVSGDGSPLGVIAGGVIGGALGNQVGKGSGRDLATIGGAVLGGIAGNQIERRAKAATRYEVAVRMDGGQRRVLRLSTLPRWREGERVAVRNGRLQAPGGVSG